MRFSVVLLIAIAVAMTARPAMAQIGWPEWESVCSTDEEAILLVHPDGTGAPLTEARLFGGEIVDATIRLRLFFYPDDPIENYPAEDIFLIPRPDVDGTFSACANGTIADHDTDENGWTEWVEPLHAGGYTAPGLDLMVAFVSGAPSPSPPCPLQVNGPDLTSDGEVNLSDIARFSQDYYGSYHVRSDLFWDGVINLSDIGLLALGLGITCP